MLHNSLIQTWFKLTSIHRNLFQLTFQIKTFIFSKLLTFFSHVQIPLIRDIFNLSIVDDIWFVNLHERAQTFIRLMFWIFMNSCATASVSSGDYKKESWGFIPRKICRTSFQLQGDDNNSLRRIRKGRMRKMYFFSFMHDCDDGWVTNWHISQVMMRNLNYRKS